MRKILSRVATVTVLLLFVFFKIIKIDNYLSRRAESQVRHDKRLEDEARMERNSLGEEWGLICRDLVEAFKSGLTPDCDEVQALASRYGALRWSMFSRFFTYPEYLYLIAEHAELELKEKFESSFPGIAAFVPAAIKIYAGKQQDIEGEGGKKIDAWVEEEDLISMDLAEAFKSGLTPDCDEVQALMSRYAALTWEVFSSLFTYSECMDLFGPYLELHFKGDFESRFPGIVSFVSKTLEIYLDKHLQDE